MANREPPTTEELKRIHAIVVAIAMATWVASFVFFYVAPMVGVWVMVAGNMTWAVIVWRTKRRLRSGRDPASPAG